MSAKKQPRRLTCERYGVVSRTVERWERDPRMGFPQPTVINGRKYDSVAELEEWERTRVTAA